MMRLRWAIVLAACIVLAAVAAAYAAGQARVSAPEVIRAQKFELVDAEGRVRGLMHMGRDGDSPALWILDEDGERRAGLGLLPDGTSGLALTDERGEARASLLLGPDGSPLLALTNEGGEVRAILRVLPDGTSGVALADEEGRFYGYLSRGRGA